MLKGISTYDRTIHIKLIWWLPERTCPCLSTPWFKSYKRYSRKIHQRKTNLPYSALDVLLEPTGCRKSRKIRSKAWQIKTRCLLCWPRRCCPQQEAAGWMNSHGGISSFLSFFIRCWCLHVSPRSSQFGNFFSILQLMWCTHFYAGTCLTQI